MIFFLERSSVKRPIWGTYVGSGLLFVEDSKVDAFFSLPVEEYSKRVFTESTIKKWKECGFTVDFLLLSVDKEETRKMHALCEALDLAHKPFNMNDMMLMWVPFRVPIEISVFEAETLTNTQAIILILRECLNADNPMRIGLMGINSRTTYLDNLYDRLVSYTLPVLWSNLVNVE